MKMEANHMLYAGLDIHKKTCQTVICTQDGKIIKEGKINNKPEEIKDFFKEFKEITIAIEACVNWEYIFETLE
jgi:predicted NBD/HSP70 family sugar kinase